MLEPGASVPLSSVPPTGANSRPLRAASSRKSAAVQWAATYLEFVRAIETCSCEDRASIRPEMPWVTPPSCWFVRPAATCASSTLMAPKLMGARSPILKTALCERAPAEAGFARSAPSVPGISAAPNAASATASATIATSDARAAERRGCPRAKASIRTTFASPPLKKLWKSPGIGTSPTASSDFARGGCPRRLSQEARPRRIAARERPVRSGCRAAATRRVRSP